MFTCTSVAAEANGERGKEDSVSKYKNRIQEYSEYYIYIKGVLEIILSGWKSR